MATFYQFSSKKPERSVWGKLEFSTNSEELYSFVENMVRAAVDATNHRNRVERIRAEDIIDCTDTEITG